MLLQLTEQQYESLVEAIYSSLRAMPDIGMGEMGECHDEAERIVDEWMEKESITLK